MNQSELIAKVADVSGDTKQTVDRVLKTAGDVVQAALVEGGEVTLPGLGKLYVKERAARSGRNPKTGETMQIAAGKSPGFKPAKALKDAVGGAQ